MPERLFSSNNIEHNNNLLPWCCLPGQARALGLEAWVWARSESRVEAVHSLLLERLLFLLLLRSLAVTFGAPFTFPSMLYLALPLLLSCRS